MDPYISFGREKSSSISSSICPLLVFSTIGYLASAFCFFFSTFSLIFSLLSLLLLLFFYSRINHPERSIVERNRSPVGLMIGKGFVTSASILCVHVCISYLRGGGRKCSVRHPGIRFLHGRLWNLFVLHHSQSYRGTTFNF